MRIREAKALAQVRLYDGAYYLGGLAVESALKSSIARMTQRYEFPDQRRVNRAYTHNLEELLRLAGLELRLNAAEAAIRDSWERTKRWNVETRYHVGRAEAEVLDFLDAVAGPAWSAAMVETVLVRADVTPRMIEAGRELVTALDAHGPEFEAAFWLMDEENGRWHLFLSSRSVKMEGSRALYADVRKVLSTLPSRNEIRTGMISIVGHRTPLVKALREALGTAASVDGARLGDAFIGDVFIPACVLYRLSRRQKLQSMTSEVRK